METNNLKLMNATMHMLIKKKNRREMQIKSNKPDNYHHLVPYAPQSHITAIWLKT